MSKKQWAHLIPVLERLWEKVEIIPSGCWQWQGAIGTTGYGRIGISQSKNTIDCHRLVYQTLVRPIEKGIILHHICRNRRCVNPEHLKVMTQKDHIYLENPLIQYCLTKTHYPQGHPYDLFNTIYHKRPNGKLERECRICKQKKQRVKYA